MEVFLINRSQRAWVSVVFNQIVLYLKYVKTTQFNQTVFYCEEAMYKQKGGWHGWHSRGCRNKSGFFVAVVVHVLCKLTDEFCYLMATCCAADPLKLDAEWTYNSLHSSSAWTATVLRNYTVCRPFAEAECREDIRHVFFNRWLLHYKINVHANVGLQQSKGVLSQFTCGDVCRLRAKGFDGTLHTAKVRDC
jgi:hypothetical protein